MNKVGKRVIVLVLVVVVAVVIAIKQQGKNPDSEQAGAANSNTVTIAENAAGNSKKAETENLPRLVDLGAGKCIPCKMMKPILDELKEEYKEKFKVVFIDVWENPAKAGAYGIRIIPTQIFFDASGKELFRHEGFYSKADILSKWKEVGVDVSGPTGEPGVFERLVAAKTDNRPKDSICYMCDGDISPETLVTVRTEKGDVRLCSPHCYFIMYSCLTAGKTGLEQRVSVTDSVSGSSVPATEAVFLYGQDESTGRPWVKGFADRAAAVRERTTAGGSILALGQLQAQELSARCGFCERACYPQDAAEVIVDGAIHTWGCCSHCALGVAARTGKDIEVHEKDRLMGEPIVVKTLNGSVASIEPATAVAWFGRRQKPDGTWGSAGCFHQGFFTSADSLKKWVEQNPYETGKLIGIHQALADKMKLSQEQIQKACKIGECVPK
ncbi:MAG TPA: thioredoxin fold domain-containing protein [Planctomycetes bacterium]|nr:thioredoxin fold domain-containing protein [Planctomycetota bacterium]